MVEVQTAYSLTRHCETSREIVQILRRLGLGRAVIADECRKIAAAKGPMANIYHQAERIVRD